MSAYHSPENVRKLANAIEGAFTFGRESMIGLDDLPLKISGRQERTSPEASSGPIGTFADAERDLIAPALEMAEWNKAEARILKISRKKLYAKIGKYHLEADFASNKLL